MIKIKNFNDFLNESTSNEISDVNLSILLSAYVEELRDYDLPKLMYMILWKYINTYTDTKDTNVLPNPKYFLRNESISLIPVNLQKEVAEIDSNVNSINCKTTLTYSLNRKTNNFFS